VTVEEHSIFGGLGTAISEVVATQYPCPLQILGIPDSFGESGESDELLEAYGLTVEAIVQHTHKALERKGTCKFG
jgi:transketolase